MRNLLIGIVALTLSGCTGLHRVPPNEQPPVAAPVAVTFTAARDLVATQGTMTYQLLAVRKMYGTVEAVRSDTLVMIVRRLESNAQQPRLPRTTRVTVVTDSFAQVAIHRVSAGKTIGLIAGLPVLALLLAMASQGFDVSP